MSGVRLADRGDVLTLEAGTSPLGDSILGQQSRLSEYARRQRKLKTAFPDLVGDVESLVSELNIGDSPDVEDTLKRVVVTSLRHDCDTSVRDSATASIAAKFLNNKCKYGLWPIQRAAA